MSTEIYNRVVDLISEELNIEKDTIKPESDFINDLNADSLDMVEMIMKVEEEFNVQLPEDTENMTTVQQLVEHLEKTISS